MYIGSRDRGNLAIEMAGDSSSSPGVQPVVLREELRPPYYGKSYSESASRAFYTRYRRYKKRVKHARRRGAIRHQVVPVSELVPVHVQRVFARLEYGEIKITSQQLAGAIKKHAGHAAPITCYRCGQVGHIPRNCQTSSGEEFGQSNAVRHPHRQHKRKRRGVRGGGSGGPSGDGGSQSSQKQQQQRQRRQHGTGSASGGAVGAVPQQAVQEEPTATVPGTEPASVEASATTPAGETVATPAAAAARSSTGLGIRLYAGL